MAGKYMRGALVEFQAPTFLVPVPNVIVFQYNPETITHTWTQPQEAPASGAASGHNPLAVRAVPGESFNLAIAMDARAPIADGRGGSAVLAMATLHYTQLCA